ncbi:histidinol-phosphate aminotransferase [Pedococcus dokdonensis]|uniref:Aromatic amino acid aminotransferase n=1 Tax=Pedococcus dokdonensis TaxID=443156 RepID=A0A1H0TUY0_9MICO|nr:histidinol-phosphate transaminase [Pedococcus dokdonensis]SDP57560.1 histidinol-phosphate aminotransferase [Pedococcus dokdonensis]
MSDAAPENTSDTDTEVRLRSALDQVPAYVPGKPAAAPEGVTAYKVSSNENPYPPLPSVLEVVRDAAASINRYPDMAVTELTQALSDSLGVPAEHVATGTGSVGVLGQVIAATCDPGDEVVYAWRSFEAYPIVTALAGAQSVQVGLDDHARHRLDAMRAAISDRTKVVIVCTPNNPTGPMVRHDELERFLDDVPGRVLVVIDEAYLEFVDDPEAPRSLELYRDRPNVMVLRTFSKAYGLAGLRIGYAVAHPPVASALRKTATPFGVNSIAQAAAVASLKAFDELKERVDALVAERTRVVAALRGQGWFIPDTQANFVWFGLGERSGDFAAAAQQAGLTLRQYGTDGVRATIGETEANDVLIEVAGAWLTEHPVDPA